MDKAGMGTVTIRLHYPTREEREELINYLKEKSWDFSEEGAFKTMKMDEKIRSK